MPKSAKKWSGAWIILALLLLHKLLHYFFYAFFYQGFLSTYAKLNAFLELSFEQLPYAHSSIIYAALQNPFFVLTFILAVAPVFFLRKKIKWTLLKEESYIKPLIGMVLFILLWEMVCYQYNFYVDHLHLIDRIALLITGVLCLYRLLFLPVFLVLLLVIYAQFSFPITGVTTVDKKLLIDLLLLFYSYLIITKGLRLKTPSFFFFAMCLVGSGYFVPGIGKLFISPSGVEWVTDNSLAPQMYMAWLKGWFYQFDATFINQYIRFVEDNGKWIAALLLLFELSFLMLMYKRRLAIVLLCCSTLFHIGIYSISGILFWKWMLLEWVLIYILVTMTEKAQWLCFSPVNRVYAVVIILTSFVTFKPHVLAWYGTQVAYVMRYEVATENGNWCVWDRKKMAPYEMLFQVDRLLFLDNAPHLKISGLAYSTDYALTQQVAQVNDLSDLRRLEAEQGKNRYDPKKRNVFVRFVRNYFKHYNAREGKGFLMYNLAPPRHFNYHSSDCEGEVKTTIAKFRVRMSTVRFSEEGVKVLDEKTLVETKV